MPFRYGGTLKSVVIELGKSGVATSDAERPELKARLAGLRD